jgi:glucosamine-6-phosphate deaminase
MKIVVQPDKATTGAAAAADGAAVIRAALRQRGAANIVLATGASQFEMLEALAEAPDIEWHAVTGFHLDEFVGLPITHKASFRLYLWQRFISRLPVPLAAFHYIDGEHDSAGECRRLGRIIREHPIDAAFVGIGENGHLAFNDPPADFDTTEPYLIVNLDEPCRRQQLGEGWFDSIDQVPRRAVSMSVRQITSARTIICTVPEQRKAEPVRAAVEGPVTPDVPASILQRNPDVRLYLDSASASLLSNRGEVA